MAPEGTQPVDVRRVVRRRRALAPSMAPRRARRGLGLLSLALLLVAALASSAQAATVGLGTADSFSVLGGSAVTNTGSSVLTGDLGVSPGTAVSGFPPGTVNGTVHRNDAVAQQAQGALTTAYDDAKGRSSTATVSGDLAGRRLGPGVYTSTSSLGLNGDLTLDAQGDPSAVFIFQAGSTLDTGANSRVLLTGGAQACNVFWQVTSSATLGTSTAFAGNILAFTSITLTMGATLDGRALARNGAVTLDTNTVTRAPCAASAGTTGGTGGGSGTGGTGGTTGGTGSGAAGAPVAVTGRASHVACDHARLEGTVHPGSSASRYYFQFGTTRRYGRRTPSARVEAGARAVRVGATVRELREHAVYHYRIVSVGADGKKTFGADRSVRTCAPGARLHRSPARRPNTRRGFTG